MRTRLLLLLSAFGFFVYAEAPFAIAQTAAPAASDSIQTAVWTPRELQVKVLYSNAQYDCDELHDDLKRSLLNLGARASDLNIDMSPCYQRVVDGDFIVKAVVKFSALAPDNTTGQNAAGGMVKARWKNVQMSLSTSPRAQVLTGSRLNHDSGANEADNSARANFRARNMAILLRTQILPLFLTRNVDFQNGDLSVRFDVLAPK